MQSQSSSLFGRRRRARKPVPDHAPDRHPPTQATGSSLVDVLCALSVLSITILAAYQSQVSSMALTRSSREVITATADLEAAMESLLALPAGEIPVAGSEFEAGQPVARFTNLHLPEESLFATYPGYTSGLPVPSELVIVLTLSWTEAQGRTRQIRARTVKLR